MNDTIAALADHDRRTVISYLDDRQGAVDIEEIATEVVAARTDTPRHEVTDDDLNSALIRLHHVDLPKLDDAGFIDFDYEAGSVRRLRGAPATTSLAFSG